MKTYLPKPPVGAPCNGCGYCCLMRICSAGSFTLGLVENYGDRAPGPCPALVKREDGGYDCGMLLRPEDYAPSGRTSAHDLRKAVSILIGAGIGCDDPGEDNSAQANEALDKLCREYALRNDSAAMEHAAETWYIKKRK
jgi:hypothetical protein